MHMIFNVKWLIDDAGGADKVAKDTMISKRTVNKWLRTGCLTTDELMAILQHNPNLSLDDYVGLPGAFSEVSREPV